MSKKTALVTGGSMGIGYEISKLLAAEGYDLVIVARHEKKLKQVKKEIELYTTAKVHILVKDLSDPKAVEEIMRSLKRKKLSIDVVVNNAGFGVNGAFAKTKLQEELDMIQVNVTAVMELTKRLLPAMVERGSGRILNVASAAAFMPGPFMANYYATKAYVLSLSRALHNELKGTGVTVSVLCPGATNTQFFKRAKMPFVKKQTMTVMNVMGAKIVARIGYKGMLKGKAVIIPGIMNHIFVYLGTRVLPRRFAISVARRFNTGGLF